jgi:hypothetical protein
MEYLTIAADDQLELEGFSRVLCLSFLFLCRVRRCLSVDKSHTGKRGRCRRTKISARDRRPGRGEGTIECRLRHWRHLRRPLRPTELFPTIVLAGSFRRFLLDNINKSLPLNALRLPHCCHWGGCLRPRSTRERGHSGRGCKAVHGERHPEPAPLSCHCKGTYDRHAKVPSRKWRGELLC